MRSQLILLLSLAVGSLALAADVQGDQSVIAAPGTNIDTKPAQDNKGKENETGEKVEKDEDEVYKDDTTLKYVYDPSKKSTRGYDIDGRQEVVNIGPGLKTTAEGQSQSRTGPRGRQRGAVLSHKYIVRLKNGADMSSFNIESRVAAHNRLIQVSDTNDEDGTEDEIITNQVYHEYDFDIWKGYAGQFSPEFLKELEEHDDVEYVEEDKLMWAWDMEPLETEGIDLRVPSKEATAEKEESAFEADAVVNGKDVKLEYYSLKAPSWGLTRIANRVPTQDKVYSYMASAGSGVDVYIIDSGVYEEHHDFEGRATNLVNFVSSESGSDTCGHGTHVAGIVAGRTYGVAKKANILAIKVLDSEGQGSTSTVLAGINYMIRHSASNPNPHKVINMSLGGQFSRPVNDAVKAAVSNHGLPFFVAAGNTGDDSCQYSPAGVEEAFTVGGSGRDDRVGWYSCVGSCVNIFAPGSGIASDWIRNANAAHVLDGTSMAAPHVTGVAALFLSSGNVYESARDLYTDIVRHSTQSIITGFKANDRKTTRNLVYNKLEDLVEPFTIKPQDLPDDHDGDDGEIATEVSKPENKRDNEGRHHHHHKA